ncbi:nucleoside hydrolase [Tessaracoccus sp. Z1128]
MTWKIGTYPWLDDLSPEPPAIRVIVDNDFAGDPDDFMQLAHHILNPGAEIVGIVASHLRPMDPFTDAKETALQARLDVERMAAVMDLDLDGRLVTGSEVSMPDPGTPVTSDGVDLIIREAGREDPRPLFVVCGGGLTDVASALVAEPGIASRLTVVWIGGPEYPDTTEPVPGNPVEYNLSIDIPAAQALFASEVELWQVPRDVYRQCLISDAELRTRIRPVGRLGQFLYDELRRAERWVSEIFGVRRATYVIGDSPLVSLTSLQTVFETTPASSQFQTRPAVQLGDDGYPTGFGGRDIRVFSTADMRLIVEDLVACLTEFEAWRASGSD